MLITSTCERMLAGVLGAEHFGCPVAVANADPWWEEPDRNRSGA
jgi:hypothetical protein